MLQLFRKLKSFFLYTYIKMVTLFIGYCYYFLIVSNLSKYVNTPNLLHILSIITTLKI